MSPVVSASVQTVLSFAGIIFPFLILPMLDWIFGRDKEDPPIVTLIWCFDFNLSFRMQVQMVVTD